MSASDLALYFVVRVMSIPREDWIALSFLPIAALVAVALWRANQDPASAFKLVHFVTADTGRGSNLALGYTVLVVVCSWGVWALIVLDKLTEWYLTLVIGGFVLGTLGGRFSQLMARAKGVADPEPTAGDSDDPPTAPSPKPKGKR